MTNTSQVKLRAKARALFGRRWKVCPNAEGFLVESDSETYPLLCPWCGLPVQLHSAEKAPLREEVVAGCFDQLKKFADEMESQYKAGTGSINHLTTARALRYFLQLIEKDLALCVPEAEQALFQKYVRVFGQRHIVALERMEDPRFNGLLAEGG